MIEAAALYKTLFISILTIERKKFKIIVLALVLNSKVINKMAFVLTK